MVTYWWAQNKCPCELLSSYLLTLSVDFSKNNKKSHTIFAQFSGIPKNVSMQLWCHQQEDKGLAHQGLYDRCIVGKLILT